MGAAPGSARSPASRLRGSAGPEGSGDITRGPLPPAGWVGPGAPRGRGVKEGEEEEQAWMCLCEDPGGAEAVERVAPGCPRQPCPARRAASVAPAAQRTGIRAPSGTPPGPAWKERESKVRRAALPSFFPPNFAPCSGGGVPLLGASPALPGVAEIRGTGGGGAREGRRSGERVGSLATSVKTWGRRAGRRRSAGARRGEREGRAQRSSTFASRALGLDGPWLLKVDLTVGGLLSFLFLLPPAVEPNPNCHSGPVTQRDQITGSLKLMRGLQRREGADRAAPPAPAHSPSRPRLPAAPARPAARPHSAMPAAAAHGDQQGHPR